jgi:alpha-tubulin suppressor-like RCC1 family protein
MLRRSSSLCLAFVALLALTACENASPPTAPRAAGEPVSPASPTVATASSPALTLFQVSSGDGFTCAIATNSVPYCWGANRLGELGVGDTAGPERCQITFPGTFPCSSKPVLVAGNHRFVRVSAGRNHACGVTADFEAWCWGENANGQLGDGAINSHSYVPVHLVGFHFRQVEAGAAYTCGITYPASRLYCWGLDNLGRFGLGKGSGPSINPRPVPVLTTLAFRQVNTGDYHTCAIAVTTGRAFCWGDNSAGELGDSTNVRFRDRPSAVVGKHVFRQITAGGSHTCAVTTADQAFCWGWGRDGAIGNGHAYLSFWPRAVSGGLKVRRVTAGSSFTCAETVTNKAYCWGTALTGQLGNGSPLHTVALTPVPVSGNHAFAQLSAGREQVCGKITLGFGWCWGHDLFGELGDGFRFEAFRLTPVRVVGP